MKIWDTKYIKEAMADEIALAPLLNYGKCKYPSSLTRFEPIVRSNAARAGRGTLGSDSGAGSSTIPQWRRNWSSAGPLISMGALKISHDRDEGSVSVGASDRRRCVTESYADHPSIDAATWAAITRATIQIRTEERDNA